MDDSEMWEKHKAERREKRWRNQQSSIKMLKSMGIPFETLDEKTAHYRIKGVSFWPTTGKYYDPRNNEKGRGVRNLIAYVKTIKQ